MRILIQYVYVWCLNVNGTVMTSKRSRSYSSCVHSDTFEPSAHETVSCGSEPADFIPGLIPRDK